MSIRGFVLFFAMCLADCGGSQALPQHAANCAEWERLAKYVDDSRRDSYVAPDARAWIESEAARDGCKIARPQTNPS